LGCEKNDFFCSSSSSDLIEGVIICYNKRRTRICRYKNENSGWMRGERKNLEEKEGKRKIAIPRG
jgi:hypothetical protein